MKTSFTLLQGLIFSDGCCNSMTVVEACSGTCMCKTSDQVNWHSVTSSLLTDSSCYQEAPPRLILYVVWDRKDTVRQGLKEQ